MTSRRSGKLRHAGGEYRATCPICWREARASALEIETVRLFLRRRYAYRSRTVRGPDGEPVVRTFYYHDTLGIEPAT
jgi:hypothetical protein